MKKVNTLLLKLTFCFIVLLSTSAKADWNINLEQKVFIENKGQYDGQNNLASSSVKYVIDNNAQIFFTQKGLTYKFKQFGKKSKEEERPGDREEDKLKVDYTFVHMEWVGANPNVQIVADEKVKEYFTYGVGNGSTTIFASAFKKIVYKNLYPNIDVVYEFHAKEGIKYTVILHPGANASDVKMKYSSAKEVNLDTDGNVHLTTKLEKDIIDHAPVTFYEAGKQAINSSFNVDGTTVTFKIDNYDNTKTVVIDPWTTNPNFINNNKAYTIDKDAAQNLYVNGGTNPFYVKKFTPGGTLIWTFNCPNANNYNGDHVTDPAGNSYVCYGAWGGNRTTKISPAGAQIFNMVNGGTWNNGEAYKMIYNCKTNLLYAVGFFYFGNYQNAANNMNMWNVNQTTGAHSGHINSNPALCIEMRGACSDDQGNLYGLTVPIGVNQLGNRLIKVTSALVPVWNVNSGYNMSEIQTSFGGGTVANMLNSVVVGCYVYTYDGLTLKKWDKNTGAQIGAAVNVPGGNICMLSGLLLDVCGNLYVGTQNNVYKYDQNLNQLANAPVGGAVYGLCMGNIPGEVIACGNGFISSVNLNVCTTVTVATTFTPPTTCGACDAIASATSNACSVSYSWNTGATTNTIGNLCPGVYTVNLIAGCSAVGTSSTVTVTGNQGFSINAAAVDANCASATGSISITTPTGVPTYTVLQNNVLIGNGVNFPYNITNVAPGNYTYFATAANGCTAVATATVNFLNTLTVSATATNVLCYGGSTGSASTTVTGGSGTYLYSWSCTGQNVANPVNLPAGSCTVTVTDGACTRTAAVVITQPPALSLAINSSTTNICAGGVINLNGFASGGTTPYGYTWTPGPTSSAYNVSEAVPGTYNYVLNVVDANGCTINNNVNLTFNVIPIISATSGTICYGDKGVLTANGAEMYKWQPINYSGSTYTTTGVNTQYLTVVGTNTSTGCSSMPVTATLMVNPLPVPVISASNNKGCVPLCMTFTSSNSGGSIGNCSWDFGDGAFASNVINTDRCYNVAGDYTVRATVTDNNGCVSSVTYSLSAYPIPVADFNYAPLKPIVNNDDVTFTDASFNAVIKKWDWYFMNLPKPHSSLQNPVYTYMDPGTYAIALLVTSDHGCVDTIVKSIIVGEDYGIYVPNVFSPNGDGLNDVFQPKGFGITKYELRLFNRWGEELMFTNDFGHGRDGYYKGKLSQEDTYIWKINLTNVFGKSHELSGHVTLIK